MRLVIVVEVLVAKFLMTGVPAELSLSVLGLGDGTPFMIAGAAVAKSMSLPSVLGLVSILPPNFAVEGKLPCAEPPPSEDAIVERS